MKYNQGDIVIIDFPFSDLSRTKKRPALIISNDKVNNTGDYLMVQITSKVRFDNLSLQSVKLIFKTTWNSHCKALSGYTKYSF